MANESPSGGTPASLTEVLRACAAHGLDFVVCGGVACLLHGVARVTNDIDLCIRLDAANLHRVVAIAHELHLRPRMPEPIEAILDSDRRAAWISQKQAQVFTLVSADGVMQVDFFLRYPIPYDELKRRSSVMSAAGVRFHVSSREDLIRAKSEVQPPRTVDLRDIEDLRKLISRDRSS